MSALSLVTLLLATRLLAALLLATLPLATLPLATLPPPLVTLPLPLATLVLPLALVLLRPKYHYSYQSSSDGRISVRQLCSDGYHWHIGGNRHKPHFTFQPLLHGLVLGRRPMFWSKFLVPFFLLLFWLGSSQCTRQLFLIMLGVKFKRYDRFPIAILPP